jgi:hypothetical protein
LASVAPAVIDRATAPKIASLIGVSSKMIVSEARFCP